MGGVNGRPFNTIADEQRDEILQRLDRIVDLFEALAKQQTPEPEPPPAAISISSAPSRRSRARKSEEPNG